MIKPSPRPPEPEFNSDQSGCLPGIFACLIFFAVLASLIVWESRCEVETTEPISVDDGSLVVLAGKFEVGQWVVCDEHPEILLKVLNRWRRDRYGFHWRYHAATDEACNNVVLPITFDESDLRDANVPMPPPLAEIDANHPFESPRQRERPAWTFPEGER